MSEGGAALSIAVVCFPSFGGSGVIAADLAVGLARRGHRVHLLASAPPGRPLPPEGRLTFREVKVPSYPLFEHAPYGLAIASALIDLGRERPLDIIHAHYAVPHAASANLARRALAPHAPRVVTTLHGTDVSYVGVDPAYRAVTRFSLTESDGLTAPSEALRRDARTLLGLSDAIPIEVIPNFVDTDHFVPAERRDRGRFRGLFAEDDGADGPILFHVSNFRAVKRVVDLVELLARIRAELPARLVLVGDGPERARVAARAVALGVRGSVAFLGRQAEIAEDLRHADAFVLTSESESFGVAALEAMSSGVPVFAYRVGGLPEVIDDTVGRLVEPFDLPALARAVLDGLSDPGRRAELGRAARGRAVALFRREPALDRYEAHYRRSLVLPARFEARRQE